MLRLRGSQAYSNFRIKKLLAAVQDKVPSVIDIDTEYQHLISLVDESSPLSSEELNKLERLLSYGPSMGDVEHKGRRLFVLPRLGTISPWSTKASDILTHCGLTKIARVERGIAFYVDSSSELNDDQVATLGQLIHDPMTESVVLELSEAEQLFRSEKPKPLFEVPLLTQGKEALQHANQDLGLALSEDEIDYLFCLLYTSPSPRD